MVMLVASWHSEKEKVGSNMSPSEWQSTATALARGQVEGDFSESSSSTCRMFGILVR